MTKAVMVRFTDLEGDRIEFFVKNGIAKNSADLVRKATILFIEKKLPNVEKR